MNGPDKRPFRVATRWGKRRVGSKNSEELMINGTKDGCLFKFAFVLCFGL